MKTFKKFIIEGDVVPFRPKSKPQIATQSKLPNLPASSLDIKPWADKSIKKSDGSSITHDHAYNHYSKHCSKNGSDAVSLNDFSTKFNKHMSSQGITKQRIAGKDRFIGVSLNEDQSRPIGDKDVNHPDEIKKNWSDARYAVRKFQENTPHTFRAKHGLSMLQPEDVNKYPERTARHLDLYHKHFPRVAELHNILPINAHNTSLEKEKHDKSNLENHGKWVDHLDKVNPPGRYHSEYDEN